MGRIFASANFVGDDIRGPSRSPEIQRPSMPGQNERPNTNACRNNILNIITHPKDQLNGERDPRSNDNIPIGVRIHGFQAPVSRQRQPGLSPPMETYPEALESSSSFFSFSF